MKRLALLPVVLMAFAVAVLPAARADKVLYSVPDGKGGKKAMTAEGTIESESLKGVSVKAIIGSDRTIAPPDITDIHYTTKPINTWGKDYLDAINYENAAARETTDQGKKKTHLQNALASYQKIQGKMADAPFPARHVHYKVAVLQTRLAEGTDQMTKAAGKLKEFRDTNTDAWQLPACLTLLAQVQSDLKDAKGAAQTFDDMAQLKGLPDAEQKRCALEAIMVLIRGKEYGDARGRINLMLRSGMTSTHPSYGRLKMLECGVKASEPSTFDAGKAELLEAIRKVPAKETALIAFGYNLVGDACLANKKAKEAVYQYLYVDLIYHQDRNEHIKACSQLALVFSQMKQDGRAQEYREKVEQLKR